MDCCSSSTELVLGRNHHDDLQYHHLRDDDHEDYDLPHDLVIEILLRLPLKSLGRFKSLSKSLCSVINSATFIGRHLLSYNVDNLHVIVQTNDLNSKCRGNRLLAYDMLQDSDHRASRRHQAVTPHGRDIMVGSCYKFKFLRIVATQRGIRVFKSQQFEFDPLLSSHIINQKNNLIDYYYLNKLASLFFLSSLYV